MYDGGEKLVYSAGSSHSSILMKAESRSDGALSGGSLVMASIAGDGVTPAGSVATGSMHPAVRRINGSNMMI